MFATQRPATYRQVSGNPGPLQLLRAAIFDIASRRRLIRYLVVAEMKKRGSDTFFGNLWWILDPVLQMVVYVVFVTIIARRPAPDYPLFIFAAILPWKWFSAVVGDAATAVVKQERLIRQIAFPKIILPVATATGGVVGFAWGLIPLGIVAILYGRLTPFVLWIPVIAVAQYVFSIAVAIFVSAANVFFRDLGNVIGHLLRLWWFLSPGLYSLTAFADLGVVKEHPWIHTLVSLNPFAVLFEAYRTVIYGSADGPPVGGPDVGGLVALLIASSGLVALAAIFFKRVEPDFAKVL
jgi:homopolymeric O-antigen transport system permease protein